MPMNTASIASTAPEVLKIAAHAGIAHTTVLAFLRGTRLPRRSTVRLITEAVEELGLGHLLPSVNGHP